MRLWSVHPKHLDSKGIVALWREGLLARQVLLGMTQGYRKHPQLERFYAQRNPCAALDSYLSRVLDEAINRGYAFDVSKIRVRPNCRMTVTEGQLDYEWAHLMKKLKVRDLRRYRELKDQEPQPHPCFRVVSGPVQAWERVASVH
jgi:hypothetical protein